jgi:Barstar (barnase inhibitor).
MQHKHYVFCHSTLRLCYIDLYNIEDLHDFYKRIAIVLEIPDYFGNNLDALEEVIHDLEWIKEETIVLTFFNSTVGNFSSSDEWKLLKELLAECDNERLLIHIL